MTTHKNLMALSVAAVFAVGLAACSDNGGDGGPTTTDPTPGTPELSWSDLMDGATVEPGTYMLTGVPADVADDVEPGTYTFAAGDSQDLAGVTFTCAAGGDACTVIIGDDSTVTSRGGNIMTAMVPVDPEPPTPPEPTPLEQVQMDAMEAATAAQTAATAARTAANAAKAAIEHLATWQTVDVDGAYYSAKAAEEDAGKAETQAAAAMAASTSAQGATDVASATRHLIVAETARDKAMDYRDGAMTKRDATMTAADSELMINGKDKSVGTTTVNVDDGTYTVTADGQTTITGRMEAMDPRHSVDQVAGQAIVLANTATNPNADRVTTPYRQAVASSNPKIGRTLDTSDDKARLMLVTSYVGSESVKVFAYAEAAPAIEATTDGRTSTTLDQVQTAGAATEATDDDTFADLKSEGTYYLAGDDAQTDGLSETDVVANDAKATRVYSYVSARAASPDTVLNTADDVLTYTYLVRHGERSVGDATQGYCTLAAGV